jgi:hypothetical protein
MSLLTGVQMNEPDKLEHIYKHRKNKDYVTVILTRENTGAILRRFLVSEKGFNGVESNEGVFATEFLPKLVNNIYVAAADLSKYLNRNGYKGVTTMTQTRNGVKLS